MQKIVSNVTENIKMKITEISFTKKHTLRGKNMVEKNVHFDVPSQWYRADDKRASERRRLPMNHILMEWSVLEYPA